MSEVHKVGLEGTKTTLYVVVPAVVVVGVGAPQGPNGVFVGVPSSLNHFNIPGVELLADSAVGLSPKQYWTGNPPVPL